MLQRLALKIALGAIGVVIAIAALATSVSFLATALANALIVALGPVYGYLTAGGIILTPFLLVVLVLFIKLQRNAVPAASPVTHTLARSLFSAVAREAPWIAAAGAATIAAADVFVNRKKPPR